MPTPDKIGCIFTLVYGYWKYHEMVVLIFILHYFLVQTLKCGMCLRQPPLHIAFIGCILHISVLVNIGCFDIGCIVSFTLKINFYQDIFFGLAWWKTSREVNIIVILNGCFDINPVLCPSTVVLTSIYRWLSRLTLYGS
jgi:hypothetical protein